jgi:hypothetical protein
VVITTDANASANHAGRRPVREFLAKASRQLDSIAEVIALAPMLDRFMLPILFGLIVLYTAVMAWANGRNRPE